MTSNHPAGTNSAIGFINSAHLQCGIAPVKAALQGQTVMCESPVAWLGLPGYTFIGRGVGSGPGGGAGRGTCEGVGPGDGGVGIGGIGPDDGTSILRLN